MRRQSKGSLHVQRDEQIESACKIDFKFTERRIKGGSKFKLCCEGAFFCNVLQISHGNKRILTTLSLSIYYSHCDLSKLASAGAPR